jgi:TM2 domain-containing membrane protein YozV
MQRAVSAALLSAFVFPGAGHLYLRHPARACLFLLPSLVALFVFAGEIMRRASALSDLVLAGRLAPDPTAIMARFEAQGGMSGMALVCGWILLACWIGAIVDSFVVARTAARAAE